MLKLLGIGVVIGASTAMGFAMSRELKKRVDQLMECKRLFIMLQGEIKYAKTPLAEGFAKVSRRMEQPFRGFLEYLSCELEGRNGKSMAEIFAESVDLKLKDSGLSSEDLGRLKNVGSHLGYLDLEMQLRSIDLCLEQINESCIQAKQEYQNKSKVYHCLGLMGGLFLAIIFI